MVNTYKTVILIGETGCGKSTQVPQFLVDSEEFWNCSIAITQPRRVSACSLAKRVAQERRTNVGKYVGYSVRFDNQTSPQTSIRYVTDGMLLREILVDPDLSSYDVVVLDEIHERTVQTDLLIGLLKQVQERRDLKIVLMSATLHCQLFSDFFNNPPIIHVSGRMYPVSTYYTEQPEVDYLDACYTAILQLHEELPTPGDFLVFLTGQEEIEEMEKLLENKGMDVRILFAALPMHQQQKVFNPSEEGKRKVILSTNIAETSITIPGIKFVIDSGLHKVKAFNPRNGIEVLSVQPISKAQALQRSGRAGRESAGCCFRLYTETSFFDLKDAPVAEIRRSNLSGVCLQLLALGVMNPLHFDFLEKPPPQCLLTAMESLYGLDAINNDGGLTQDGDIMSKLPLSPEHSKILLLASRNACGASALTLLAMLTCENLFVLPGNMRKKARKQHQLFVDETGDHMTLLNIYEAFLEANDRKKWCLKHFLSMRALEYAENVRRQLEQHAKDLNLPIIEGDDEKINRDNLRSCLASALCDNVAVHVVSGKYKAVSDGSEIYVHPSSFAFNAALPYIVFSERVQTKRLYARWVSLCDQGFAVIQDE